MDNERPKQLSRFIKVLLDVIYGMLILVIASLVIWMVLSPILANLTNTPGSVSIPVSLGTGDIPRLDVSLVEDPGFSINDISVEDANGILRVETTNPFLVILANSSKLLLAIGLAYMFYQLRKVVQTIQDGNTFSGENIQAIRKLGYAVLVVGFGSGIIEGIVAWEIINLLPATVPVLQAQATFDSRLVLGTALFIFLLVQIWSYGYQLEREQELTI